ncbi:RNA-guided endonuclease TnpB family protein [Halomonas cibimaris]|uniref:RNA-guided endonuclease TnpB family protein n=1 Tax=Halomonas cibimaris TaxID=657012 RepID=A0ABP7LMK9_9GAMM
MKVLKAYRFKLNPTPEAETLLYRMAGCGRVVYNKSLELMLDIAQRQLGADGDRKALYKQLNDLAPRERIELAKHFPSSAGLNKLVTQWKRQEGLAFLKEAYTDNLQQRQRDLRDKAVKDWCSGKRGFPVFRAKRIAHHSTMRFVNFPKYCALDHRRIKLPNKLGWLKMRQSRVIEGEPRNATVSLDACGNWHVAVMCSVEVEPTRAPDQGAVGIDMGIAKNMTLSDGTAFAGVRSFAAMQGRLATAQRKLKNKKRGSANWKKQRRKVSRIHQRIADVRRDYQHKATTTISNNHAMVAVEDLRVANMSKSARGTVAQPGRNVRQKAGLNRSILDQGWYEIRRQLEYKMSWTGGLFVAVAPHYTSQTCPACLYKSADNRKTQAAFLCTHCGFAENADVVGAINVLHRGLDLLGPRTSKT